MTTETTPPGWYHGDGDPAGSLRWWDGSQWVGDAQLNMGNPGGAPGAAGGPMSSDAFASIPRRLFGRLIDMILAIIPPMLVLGGSMDFDAMGDAFDELSDAPAGDTTAQTVFQDSLTDIFETGLENAATGMAVCFLAVWIIEVLMVKFLGATPGKLLMGTRITNAESDGTAGSQSVSWLQAVIRTGIRLIGVIGYIVVALSGILSILTLIVGLASLIMLFAVDTRQTVMDKLARTIVLKRSAVSK